MKKIISTFLCIFALFSLVGCNTNTATPEGTPATEVLPPSPIWPHVIPEHTPTPLPTESIFPENTPTPTPEPTLLLPIYGPREEEPTAMDENGDPYFPVEDEVTLIHCPIGFFTETITSFDDIWEGATEASHFQDITTLPVVRRQSYWYLDDMTGEVYTKLTSKTKAKIDQWLIDAGKIAGITIDPKKISVYDTYDYQTSCQSDNIELNADGEGFTIRLLKENLSVSIDDKISGETLLELLKANKVLTNMIEYANFPNLVCKRYSSYSYAGIGPARFYIYNEEEDPYQTLLNQNFNRVELYFAKNGDFYITYHHVEYNDNIMREYEFMSCEEAKKAIDEGNSLCNIDFSKEDIHYIDMVYLTKFNERYYIPYYQFYIYEANPGDPEGLQTWCLCFVPAVKGIHFPLVNDPHWEYPQETTPPV